MNAMKYASKFGPAIAVLCNASKHFNEDTDVDDDKASYWLYFGTQLFTTLFCLYWDFIWDWGLFNTKVLGRKFLRNEL